MSSASENSTFPLSLSDNNQDQTRRFKQNLMIILGTAPQKQNCPLDGGWVNKTIIPITIQWLHFIWHGKDSNRNSQGKDHVLMNVCMQEGSLERQDQYTPGPGSLSPSRHPFRSQIRGWWWAQPWPTWTRSSHNSCTQGDYEQGGRREWVVLMSRLDSIL